MAESTPRARTNRTASRRTVEDISMTANLTLHLAEGGAILSFPPEMVDALRYMTTRLLVNGELPDQLAVLAALRSEGVTTTALGLATVLANDTARRVCYLDLNWYWPSPDMGGVGMTNRGAVAVVNGEVDLEDVLVRTNYANLNLLPAGPLSPKQRPVVARSSTLRTLVDGLTARFDHLLIDVPAILTTSDAIPLASLAQACCVVVRQGVSNSSLTTQALQRVDHLPMLGAIMNRTHHQTPSWLLKWIPQE